MQSLGLIGGEAKQTFTEKTMDTRIKRKTYRNANLKHLYEKIKGGHVTRYHTRPELTNGQNVAAHTWRAMVNTSYTLARGK